MAEAIWPVSLPQAPRVSDLTESPPALVVRTEMSVGPAKVRRQITKNVRPFHIALDMTGAQVATFDAFFVDTCMGGALAFQWKHPRTGNPIDFRFVGQPAYTPRTPRLANGADQWRVMFDLESLPGTEVTGPVEPPPSPDGGLILMMAPPVLGFDDVEIVIDEVAPIENDILIFDTPIPPIEDLFVMLDTPGYPEDAPPMPAAEFFDVVNFPHSDPRDTSAGGGGSDGGGGDISGGIS